MSSKSFAPTWPVLVVDDDPSVLQLTELLLGRISVDGRKLEVVPCRSAQEARERLGQASFALAIVDVVMETEHAGLDLVRAMRAERKHLLTPIVVRSGQPGAYPEARVLQDYRISDYWPKDDLAPQRVRSKVTGLIRGYETARTVELESALAAAEAAAAARARFVANVSHELRTPVTAILGFADLALGLGDLSSAAREHVEHIRVAADALLGIVNDTLDASKIDAGHVRLGSHPFDLDEVLSSVSLLIGQVASSKGVALTIERGEEVPTQLVGDALRLQQVLTNLVSNAVKFTERGRVTVGVLCDAREGDDVVLRFEVADTGIGMTPAQLEQVFQPFVQAEVSTSRRFGGTGLGLSISKSLAEAMGGSLSATSEEGKGSVFVARVRVMAPRPAHVVEVATTARGATRGAHAVADVSLEAQQPAKRPLEGISVVVVDDSGLLRSMLERLLISAGAAVATAASAQDALELVASRAAGDRPDVVLMDVEMQDVDGLEATRRLRQLSGCAQIPVLALTGHSDPETHERAIAAGMQECLTKPIDRTTLVEAVERWTQRAAKDEQQA